MVIVVVMIMTLLLLASLVFGVCEHMGWILVGEQVFCSVLWIEEDWTTVLR